MEAIAATPRSCCACIVFFFQYLICLCKWYRCFLLASILLRPSWLWSYSSWIYNYLCKRCNWSCQFKFHSREVYSIQHYVIKFVSHVRQVGGFLRVLWFPPLIKLSPRYNWNIVESDVKHHNHNPNCYCII